MSQLLSCPFVQLPIQIDASRLREEIEVLSTDSWEDHQLPNLHSIPLVTIQKFQTQLCPVLQQLPYLSAILTSWKIPLGESRISILGPHAKVPSHVDVEHYWKHRWRVHMVVQSNPEALFGCDHQILHLPAGQVWVSNNWAPHWIENTGETNRIHIVIDTIGAPILWDLIERGWHSDTNIPMPTTEDLPLLRLDPSTPIHLIPESYSKLDIRTPSEVDEIVEDTLIEVQNTLSTSHLEALHKTCTSFKQQWQDLFQLYGHSHRRHYQTCLHQFLTSIPNVHLPNGLTFKQIFNRQIGASLTPIPQLHVHLFWKCTHNTQDFLGTINDTDSLVVLSSTFKSELQTTFLHHIKSKTLSRQQFLERLVGELQHPNSDHYWMDQFSNAMSPSLNLWIDINDKDALSNWQDVFPQHTMVAHPPHPSQLQSTSQMQDAIQCYQYILDNLENTPHAHWVFLLNPNTPLSTILDTYHGNLTTLPHRSPLDRLDYSTWPAVSISDLDPTTLTKCARLYEQLIQRLQPPQD